MCASSACIPSDVFGGGGVHCLGGQQHLPSFRTHAAAQPIVANIRAIAPACWLRHLSLVNMLTCARWRIGGVAWCCSFTQQANTINEDKRNAEQLPMIQDSIGGWSGRVNYHTHRATTADVFHAAQQRLSPRSSRLPTLLSCSHSRSRSRPTVLVCVQNVHAEVYCYVDWPVRAPCLFGATGRI